MSWPPKTWVNEALATAADFNEFVRDPLNNLDQHKHTGAVGDGDDALGPIATENFADQAASPAVNGRLQRNGAGLEYYDGTTAIAIGKSDQAAGVASPRTLGSGATQAAAGNHAHTLSQNATRESKNAENTGPSSATFYFNQAIGTTEVTLVNDLAAFSAGANGVIIVGTVSGGNQDAGAIVVTLRIYYNDILQVSQAVTFAAGGATRPTQHWSAIYVKNAPQSGDVVDLRIISDVANSFHLVGWSLRVVEIDEAAA